MYLLQSDKSLFLLQSLWGGEGKNQFFTEPFLYLQRNLQRNLKLQELTLSDYINSLQQVQKSINKFKFFRKLYNVQFESILHWILVNANNKFYITVETTTGFCLPRSLKTDIYTFIEWFSRISSGDLAALFLHMGTNSEVLTQTNLLLKSLVALPEN